MTDYFLSDAADEYAHHAVPPVTANDQQVGWPTQSLSQNRFSRFAHSPDTLRTCGRRQEIDERRKDLLALTFGELGCFLGGYSNVGRSRQLDRVEKPNLRFQLLGEGLSCRRRPRCRRAAINGD